MWAKGKNTGLIYKIEEGTGDNLQQEDIDQGYVDYIYYDSFKSLNDIYDNETYDGGVYYLKDYYADHSKEEILKMIGDFEDDTLEEINL